MAIQMDVNFRGIELKDAYIKIGFMSVDNNLKTAEGTLTLHAIKGEPALPFDSYPMFANIKIEEGIDVREQVYDELMAKPEFIGAVRVD
jgi:hypothetical protein